MRIHLVSLILCRLESDLIPFFIKHYKDMPLWSKNIFLHVEGTEPTVQDKKFYKLFSESGFKCSYIKGPFDDGNLRSNAVLRVQNLVSPNDYIMVVDGDELVDINFDKISGDYICTNVIERFNKKLIEVKPNVNLFKQFPMESTSLEYKIDSDYFQFFDVPFSHKILLAKSFVKIDYRGSHALLPDQGLLKRGAQTANLYHFRYRKRLASKLRTKSYNTHTHIAKVLKAFC